MKHRLVYQWFTVRIIIIIFSQYAPERKGLTGVWLPVAASFGILTSGNTNFPQIAIHAKTDFDVNDKIWVFDVATGEFRAPGRITATEILLSGKSRVALMVIYMVMCGVAG